MYKHLVLDGFMYRWCLWFVFMDSVCGLYLCVDICMDMYMDSVWMDVLMNGWVYLRMDGGVYVWVHVWIGYGLYVWRVVSVYRMHVWIVCTDYMYGHRVLILHEARFSNRWDLLLHETHFNKYWVLLPHETHSSKY
jgi:hypothetical protein